MQTTKAKSEVLITAECTCHGRFTVLRKLNKRQDTGSGRVNNGFYDAVKCPKCPWWAKIIEQKIVAKGSCGNETQASLGLPLEGADA
uniref:Uncharacterized protein n=1 Tax=Geobacter sp. (strain M21) TaxID=443144 RepID=C6E6T0_GEOSM